MWFAGAEVAVLCITKSGEVLNYQAFTNSRGVYTVAETMPESDRWDSCLARPISSYHEHCTRRGDAHSAVKFTYTRPSGYSHAIKPFLYKPVSVPAYCIWADNCVYETYTYNKCVKPKVQGKILSRFYHVNYWHCLYRIVTCVESPVLYMWCEMQTSNLICSIGIFFCQWLKFLLIMAIGWICSEYILSAVLRLR